jgi:acetyl esterase/lipase
MRRVPVLFLLILLAGCRPVEILDAFTSDSGYRLQSDLAYGDLERQKLDVYAPEKPVSNPAPVIVFFYGGSWNSGAKGDYRFVAQRLAEQGYVVVIPDYRLYPEARFPVFLEDGALALRWVQNQAKGFGGDAHRIFLMGHSAGAYNAVMLALDPRWTAKAGFDRDRLKGVIGLAGPYDFKLNTDLLRGVFGGVPDPAETQPVSYATTKAPPMLLLTGEDDETVEPRNSESLARHLRENGNPVRLRRYPNEDHVDLILDLSSFLNASNPVLDAILDFLRDPKGD